jgi:ParB-like chromosome segregation protein Spo0J
MPDKNVITVEISKLTPHPQNARVHDIPKIMRSLERFGLMKYPIVQKSTGHIIAGHGTIEAATRLGWKNVDVQVVDVDDETAKGYLVADNASSDSSTYDKGKLLDLLGSALSLEGLGFDEEDIAELKEEVSEKKTTPRKKTEVKETKTETPLREIPLKMPADQAQAFSSKVLDLQRVWGSRTLVEVVDRALSEAHERWKSQEASAPKAPEFAAVEF